MTLIKLMTCRMYLHWVEQAPGHFLTRTLQYMTPAQVVTAGIGRNITICIPGTGRHSLTQLAQVEKQLA